MVESTKLYRLIKKQYCPQKDMEVWIARRHAQGQDIDGRIERLKLNTN